MFLDTTIQNHPEDFVMQEQFPFDVRIFPDSFVGPGLVCCGMRSTRELLEESWTLRLRLRLLTAQLRRVIEIAQKTRGEAAAVTPPPNPTADFVWA